MYTIQDLFDLTHTLAGDYLARFTYPWEALAGISDLILTLGPALGADYESPAPDVWVHKTARVAPTAFLGGPCIIGPDTEVRHGAFIRGSALVGAGCVVGGANGADSMTAMMNSWAIVSGVVAAESAASYAK